MTSRFYPPSAEIDIAAPVQRVWDVLLDGARYPEWNKFIFEVRGELDVPHKPIAMQVRLGRFVTRPVMQVVMVQPPGEDGEAGRWVHQYADGLARRGWLCSERHHEMTPIEGGAGTRYRTWEDFSGWMRGVVPYRSIDTGFKQQADALRRRAEMLCS